MGPFFPFHSTPFSADDPGQVKWLLHNLDRFRSWVALAAGRDPLLPVALAAGIGIAVADRLPLWVPLAAPAILAGICFALALWKPRRPVSLWLGAASVYALAQSVTLWSAGQFPFSPNLRNGDTIRVSAKGLVIEEPAAPGAGGTRNGRCVVRFTEMSVAGHTWHCDQRLPVRLSNPNETPRYGDIIATTGLLRPFPPPASPGAFDPKAFFFRTLGAAGEFAIGPGDRIEIVERGRGNPVVAWAVRSKGMIERMITRGLEERPEDAAVIKAMVLGSREDTPEHIEEAYRLSGAMHVFSVSGLHVAIFASVIWAILRTCRVPRRIGVLILIPTILFYATVTGLPASAVRAGVMGAVVLFAYLVERRPRLLNSLGFSWLLILAFDPQQLFLPGFQLSFAVLTSMALFAESLKSLLYQPWQIDPFLPRRLVPRWRRGVDRSVDWLTNSLGVSIAAFAGSALLIVHHFQITTPIAVLANVVMVPAAFLVLAVAIGSLLISLVGGGWLAGAIVNPLNGWLARGVTGMAVFFADAPGGFVHVSTNPLSRSLPESGARMVIYEPNITGFSQLFSTRSADGREVHWLIDPGDPVGFTSAGQPLLRHAGVNRLQALVLTHGDFDHLGAAPTLIDRFRPAAVIDSLFDSRSSTYPKILESLDRSGSRHLRVGRGDRIPIGADTDLSILYPPRGDEPASLADDRCLVLLIRHGDWRILLTSDSGFPTEKWLLDRESRGLEADVWIKGWHASDASGLTEFLDQVRPAAVIATNHEFPARQQITEAWRTEVASRGAELFDLGETGAVSLDIAPDRLRVVPHVEGRAVLEIPRRR